MPVQIANALSGLLAPERYGTQQDVTTLVFFVNGVYAKKLAMTLRMTVILNVDNLSLFYRPASL